MKRVILHIKNFIFKSYQKPAPLGRWNIESCHKKLNNKIDLANEDHCGPCGEYSKKVGFRGVSDSVAVNESHKSLLGIFIRKGSTIVSDPKLLTGPLGMSADNLTLYNLMMKQFQVLSRNFGDIIKKDTRKHANDIHQDVSLRRGVFTSEPSNFTADIKNTYNDKNVIHTMDGLENNNIQKQTKIIRHISKEIVIYKN